MTWQCTPQAREGCKAGRHNIVQAGGQQLAGTAHRPGNGALLCYKSLCTGQPTAVRSECMTGAAPTWYDSSALKRWGCSRSASL